ncbi:SAM and PH domain-containing protein [Ophiocordyceps camponoti-floridani]|uniref:SAM and PH domain-containing protein n=1 Tax=Ophiocordyceps camponoti-floridani TaxID=2030778 RepID=A0A8H4QBR9_9HYPO|nr:SAM and PH domain-containing protein [Ophiocordyceps camponoti-floridani]
MRQKPIDESFYSKADAKAYYQRPISVATEFVDIDWDEEVASDAEDNSPRVSLQSLEQPSITTVSSYDEAPTPRSSTGRAVLTEAFVDACCKQVQGPRGPHLFRSSTDPSFLDEDLVLTLSPLAPQDELNKVPERLQPLQRESPAKSRRTKVGSAPLLSWTPEMVAQFMIDAGIDVSVADRFIENDISGEIVMTLKFEDLRELDIASFGIRTRVWHQIQSMRDSRPSSPRPSTPIEDVPSREARKEARAASRTDTSLQRRQSSRQRSHRRPSIHDDGVAPLNPLSIIAIEQLIPKAHHCSKGEDCPKWKRQQRAIDDFQKAHPQVDVNAGGTVVIFGDAGNPETARAIDPHEDVKQRPVSDAVQSVAASSDVFGPSSPPPMQYLQETVLRGVRSRDPQDNVRQFLSFQYQQGKGADNEVPPTPPFELGPAATYPHSGLRRLPKLCIPGGAPSHRRPSLAQLFPPSSEPQPGPERSASCSPEVDRRGDPRRLVSPFSDLDVPVTAVPTGPVARNVSQSVPPELGHRASPPSGQGHARSQSRVSARRPSFPVLPALDEHKAVSMASKSPSPKTPSSKTAGHLSQRPLQAPPRSKYPWSPLESTAAERTMPPSRTLKPLEADGIAFQGPMRKRKMRLFRHEWQNAYFTIRGTRLNMHKDEREVDRTLEYIDIDDYAIACSNLASSSKLSAAFKAMHISHSRGKSDPISAFSFQLIPQDKETGLRLRKRDSSVPGGAEAPAEAVNGTGKTHHFAVKSREERVDWMRELMLAKALKQKGEGFEISVNGNMI